MQDYIDYELDKYYQMQDEADDMTRLGFEDYDEYIEYLEDEKAQAEIANCDAMMDR